MLYRVQKMAITRYNIHIPMILRTFFSKQKNVIEYTRTTVKYNEENLILKYILTIYYIFIQFNYFIILVKEENYNYTELVKLL